MERNLSNFNKFPDKDIPQVVYRGVILPKDSLVVDGIILEKNNMSHWYTEIDALYSFYKMDPSEFLEDFNPDESVRVILECHNLVGVDSKDVLIDSKSPYASKQEVTSIGYDFLIKEVLNKTINNVDCLVCIVEQVPNNNQILKNNYYFI